MLGTHDLWLFAATVFVLNATPGVDLMLTLTRTVQHGVRGGLAAAFGVAAGCIVHALAAALGLAAVLATSAVAFAVLRWAGAAYLLWLGFGLLRVAARPALPAAVIHAAGDAAPRWRLFRQGFFTNVLNPKVAIFFLALLPQFIDSAAAQKTLAFLFLGAWFVIQSLFFLAAFVLSVAPLARWRPRPAIERLLQAFGGLLFIGLATRLALSQRP